MFPSEWSQYFSLKKRRICENQPIFVEHLPIKFFYFEDFRWSFFGKMIGQKQPNVFTKNGKKFHRMSNCWNNKWERALKTMSLDLLANQKNKDRFFTRSHLSSIKETYEKVKNFAKNRDYLPSFLYLCESKFHWQTACFHAAGNIKIID